MNTVIRLKSAVFHVTAFAVLMIAVFPSNAQNRLSSSEVAVGWLNFFDGSSTYGWDSISGWQPQDQMLTAPMSSDSRMVSALPFADFLLYFEYRLNATPAGASVRIRAPRGEDPADSGYRVTLGDSKPEWPAGSIVLRSKNTRPAPGINVWHSVSIEADGGRIVVMIDGQKTAETADDAARAGYIHFENPHGVRLDLRSIYVQPLHVNSLFNGSDLSGWKNVSFVPSRGSIAKIVGGSKPHDALWSVRGGMIHGEVGPGALETSGSYDDFVLRFSAAAKIDKDKSYEAFPAIYLRNDAGTVATGYPIGFANSIGEIRGLAKPRKSIKPQDFISQTVVAGGHVFGVFLNGNLETLYTDTRPEGPSAKTSAKINGGTISIAMPVDIVTIDVSSIAIENIPNAFGGVVHAPAPPPPAAMAMPSTTTSAQQQSATIEAQTAQIAAALGAPTAQSRKQVADLMSQALKTSDPNQQMQLYDQVVHLDPNNAAAVQGYKEAAAKVAEQQLQSQQQLNQTQQRDLSESERESQISNSLIAAQSYFLGGNLKQADASLRTAEHLDANNPLARDLRLRIDAARGLRHRLLFLGGAVGILAIFGAATLFWRSRRQARFPVLRVLHGLDQGRVYPIDSDIVRIGGITQDRGQKNDIVIRDVEHMISRFHCEVHKKDGNFFLLDVKSSNGTRVNGKSVLPNRHFPLRKGAKIDLGGSTVLQFNFEKKDRA